MRSPGTVEFRETFTFKIGSNPLNIEVQEVTGSPMRLGSIKLEPHEIQELAEWAFTQYTQSAKKGTTEHALVAEQFHMCRSVDDSNEEEKVKLLHEVGFKPHKLSNGGYIWLAFCSVKNTSSTTRCAVCA